MVSKMETVFCYIYKLSKINENYDSAYSEKFQNVGSLSNIPDSIESLHNQKYLPSNQ